MIAKHANSIVCAGYLLFFGLLFLQFPLKSSLPGNCDTWLAISQANRYVASIQSVFSGKQLGTSMYPSNVMQQAFGESSVGVAVPFVLSKLLGLTDVWAYFILLCFTFGLSAFGVYLLCLQHSGNLPASVFGGLAFAGSGFCYANIDDPIVVFVFVLALCLYYARFFLETHAVKYAYYAAMLGGVQVLFSAYVFLFLCLFLAVMFVFALPKKLRQLPWQKTKHLLLATTIFMFLPCLFFLFYFNSMKQAKVINPTKSVMVAELCSLDFGDLANSLPNTIYGWDKPFTGQTAYDLTLKTQAYGIAFANAGKDESVIKGKTPDLNDELFWISTRRHAFSGLLLLLLAIGGLFAKNMKHRKELALVCSLGFIICLGPGTLIGNHFLPMPMHLVYKYIPPSIFFRVPLRAFVICLLCLCIFSSIGLSFLLKHFEKPKRIATTVAICCLIFAIENTPFPMRAFAGSRYASPPPDLAAFFDKNAKKEPSVVLHLPSQMGLANGNDDDDLFEFNREFVYMNWQTQHGQHIQNGINGYFPESRLEVQKLINALPDSAALKELIKHTNLNYIAFHRNTLLEHEKDISSTLSKSPLLEILFEKDETVLYKTKNI